MTDKLHQTPHPHTMGRRQPHPLPRYLLLMINTYTYVYNCLYIYICIYACIAPTYSIYLLPTILYTVSSTCLLPTHCLYTTYTARLQKDRSYLCNITIHSTYVPAPLVWMHQLFYIPIQHVQPPPHPNPRQRGRGDTMNTLHTQPSPTPTHAHIGVGGSMTRDGGWGGEPSTWNINIYTHIHVQYRSCPTVANSWENIRCEN